MKKFFIVHHLSSSTVTCRISSGLPLINDRENRNTKNCIFKKLDLAASKVYYKLLSPII